MSEHTHTDDHDHGHEHPHSHPHTVEHNPESSATGSVVIDIGGNVGAAAVTTPASLNGQEIEIRPEPGEWDGTHVAVLPRHLGSETRYAALFPALSAGSYRVRVRFGAPDAVVVGFDVTGGIVEQVTWPED